MKDYKIDVQWKVDDQRPEAGDGTINAKEVPRHDQVQQGSDRMWDLPAVCAPQDATEVRPATRQFVFGKVPHKGAAKQNPAVGPNTNETVDRTVLFPVRKSTRVFSPSD
ncbi:MAG: hypothetical protein MK364_23810 [Pirellulales bacterium]|nr:hypothetical protein [Pirellulales bacterium]